MADVEGFGNVGRRVLYDDFLALPRAVAAVAWDFVRCEMGEGVHLRQHVANECRAFALEM